MMLSYNTQVHRATMESPFFLHDPRLPYFDMDRPKPMYKDNFSTEAITRLEFSYRLAKENMEEANKLREAYVNKKSICSSHLEIDAWSTSRTSSQDRTRNSPPAGRGFTPWSQS